MTQQPASVAELTDIVQHAAAHDTALRLVGAGTWLTGGGPFVEGSSVSLRAFAGVCEYEPGDLVITVGAGTSLAELAHVTAQHGQTLAALPYGSTDGTIGATVASASSAPLALSNLSIRDLVLGLTLVTGTGESVRGGGRVVKNVAGFDLVRLNTGAWGTLGAIIEVTLRLHAIPNVEDITVGTLDTDLARALPALVANRAPLPMLVRCPPGRAPELWARISGNAARADALRTHLTTLGMRDAVTIRQPVVLRDTAMDGVVLRARTAVSDAVPFVAAARAQFPAATSDYDPARGSLRIALPLAAESTEPDALDRQIAAFLVDCATRGATHPVSVIVEQGRTTPHERNALESGVKHAFDPRDVLNRLQPRT